MDEIAHWLLAQLSNGIDLAMPWWLVRYTAYLLTTAVASAFLARMLWKRVFGLQFRPKRDRVPGVREYERLRDLLPDALRLTNSLARKIHDRRKPTRAGLEAEATSRGVQSQRRTDSHELQT